MNFSHIKAFLILLSLTAQTVPSIAAVFNADTIDGVEVEIRRPDNGIYPLIIFSHGMGACPADYAGIQDRLVNAGYIVVSQNMQTVFQATQRLMYHGASQESGQRQQIAIEEMTFISC